MTQGSTTESNASETALDHKLVESQSAFHLQEYAELRQEILVNTEETRKLEMYCLIAVALVFSWVATEGSKAPYASNLYFTASMPAVLVAFGWMKSMAIEQNIVRLGKYISILEKRLAKDGRGWEHHYGELTSKVRYTPERISTLFWPALFLATVIGGLVLMRGTPLFSWLIGT